MYDITQNGQFIWGITNLLVTRIDLIDLHRTFFNHIFKLLSLPESVLNFYLGHSFSLTTKPPNYSTQNINFSLT